MTPNSLCKLHVAATLRLPIADCKTGHLPIQLLLHKDPIHLGTGDFDELQLFRAVIEFVRSSFVCARILFLFKKTSGSYLREGEWRIIIGKFY